MTIPTILRNAEHKALRRLLLGGEVIDLGGDTRSAYRSFIQGSFHLTTLNQDEAAHPDILQDLEEPLSIADASYDHALLINVLEHIFAYQQLLRETQRIIRPGGTAVIVVPFLFPLHPSPKDFWRFSPDALSREIENAGLSVESVEVLGAGVFAAQFVMIDRLLPGILRALLYPLRIFVMLGDWLFEHIAGVFGKKYRPSDYALGFVVIARKQA